MTTAAPTGADDVLAALAAYADRMALAATLEDVIDAALTGLDELLGYSNSMLLVHERELGRLVTFASRGYAERATGSEVLLGEGLIGMVGARRRTMRIGNLQRMLSYARTVRRASADEHSSAHEIQLPGLADARSQLAAPMIARQELVGVLAVESSTAVRFAESDERVLSIAAQLVAAAFEREQVAIADPDFSTAVGAADPEPADISVASTAASAATASSTAPAPSTASASASASSTAPSTASATASATVRFYAVDGSTFIDDGYVIKGVAGRLLWKLVSEHVATGRTSFTNREVKLDAALELPPYRDNFESRLILLKRRLDDRAAPVRIRPCGRGRFDIEVLAALAVESVASP